MENLPELDIVEDVKNLIDDDDVIETKPEDIFITEPPSNKSSEPILEQEREETPKKKPKKKISKRQAEHLAKAREKAKVTNMKKRQERLEVEKRVRRELEDKRRKKEDDEEESSKRPQTPKPQEEYIVGSKPMPIPPPNVTPEPDNELDFNIFMSNMKKYKKMKHNYYKAQWEEAKRETEPPKQKPKPRKPDIIQHQPTNPFSNAFTW